MTEKEFDPKCPVCSSPVIQVWAGEEGKDDNKLRLVRYEPAPLSPAVLAIALDNEQVCRAVSGLATKELRLAIAAVMLEGGTQPDPFFTEQDVRDEAEAAARCDGVAAQLTKATRFDSAYEFRSAAERHRTRAKRILLLMPEATQRKIHAQMHAGPLGANVNPGVKLQ